MSDIRKSISEQKNSEDDSILKLRANDYENKREDSLLKSSNLFKPVKDTEDIFNKYNTTGKEKLYFFPEHAEVEYFAMEILVRLGFYAPKCRIIEEVTPENEKDTFIAVRWVDGYIPMLNVRHDVEPSSDERESALEFRKQYKLDIPSQHIISLMDGVRYKISGNAFASDLAAILIGDTDFQPAHTNLGIVRKGNRFYCVAIDKEHASFEGESYDALYKKAKEANIVQDALYSSRTHDQIIYVLNRLDQALVKRDDQCDIDRIFKNNRVLKTKSLEDHYYSDCENFKKSAVSLLQYYHKKYGENYLSHFIERENIRAIFVEAVIKKLNLSQSIKDILMEDLRAPYYQHLFINKKQISKADLDNKALLNAMLNDVSLEFNISARNDKLFQSPAKPPSK